MIREIERLWARWAAALSAGNLDRSSGNVDVGQQSVHRRARLKRLEVGLALPLPFRGSIPGANPLLGGWNFDKPRQMV